MLRTILRVSAACTALAVISALAAACSSESSEGAPVVNTGADSGADGPSGPVEKVGCDGCTVFTGATLFDGTAANPGTLIVEGTKIKAVVRGAVEVTAGTRVDATGKTILPGLFDMHVHSPASSGPTSFFPQGDLVPDHLKASLRAGVTSYLDLGAEAHVIFEWRARLAAKKVVGPHLFAVGPMFTTTGGHPCYSGTPVDDSCERIDSPSDVAGAIARLVPQHPDLLKVILEPGSQAFPLPRMATPSIAAVQDAAQKANLRVIAHVGTTKDVEDALTAGIRLFAHVPAGDLISADLAQRMATANVVVVPTLAVFDGYYRTATRTLSELDDSAITDDVPSEVVDALKDPQQLADMTDPSYIAWLKSEQENAAANLKTIHAAGVRIAAGTDAGNPGTFHGFSLRRELALYVQQGLTPVEALVAATKNAADVLDRKDLGRLEAGALADLLVVNGDPTADIQALSKIDSVYVEGKAIDRAALALRKGTSVFLQPTTNQPDGAACLLDDECGAKLTCTFDHSCARVCSKTTDCGGTAKCANLGIGSPYCTSAACDPIAQDCLNQAACIWLGDGATLCTFDYPAGTPGMPCGAFGACARGSECDLQGTCRKICKPGAAGTCPGSQTCTDLTTAAGMSVGECH